MPKRKTLTEPSSPAACSAEDPRIYVLSVASTDTLIGLLREVMSPGPMSLLYFIIGMDHRFATTQPIALFDLIIHVLRTRMPNAEAQRSPASGDKLPPLVRASGDHDAT